MNTNFARMSALLNAVWPEVSQIEWSQYCGTNVAAYDDSGVPKYTGLLMHRSIKGAPCLGATTAAVGFLPRPEKSATIVTTKTKTIFTGNRDVIASIELRDPERGLWGGGIRVDDKTVLDSAYAITGLPEIGDHLLIANMMYRGGLLSSGNYVKLVDSNTSYHPQMANARKYVNMAPSQFKMLGQVIESIVTKAALDLELI